MHCFKPQAACTAFQWLTCYPEAVGLHRTCRQWMPRPSSKTGSWGDTWESRCLPGRGELCGPAAVCPPPGASVCKAGWEMWGRAFNQPADASRMQSCWNTGGTWGIIGKASHNTVEWEDSSGCLSMIHLCSQDFLQINTLPSITQLQELFLLLHIDWNAAPVATER